MSIFDDVVMSSSASFPIFIPNKSAVDGFDSFVEDDIGAHDETNTFCANKNTDNDENMSMTIRKCIFILI
jgi:hypothetical protein